RMNGTQVVTQRHTIRIDHAGIDTNIVEPTEAEEMRDALTDGQHRQRLPDVGFKNARERGVGGLATLDGQPDRDDRLADVVVDGCLRLIATEHTKDTDENWLCESAANTHQNACLTRNSNA